MSTPAPKDATEAVAQGIDLDDFLAGGPHLVEVPASAPQAASSAPTSGPTAPEPLPPEDADATWTEDRLALEFTRRHGERWRFVALWGEWLRFDGAVWRPEKTLAVFDLVRRITRELAEPLPKAEQRRLLAANTIAAIERLARADRQHAATVDQWDADPWLLGTPSGVVDLRTGLLGAGRPEHYLTKSTAVDPVEVADCPRWRRFLDRVTDGSAELQDFLQRFAGYALTGATREHVFLFLYGTGRNGKGVFLNTLTDMLGDYATIASAETFTISYGDRHPTDIAALRGARLVAAQETEEGRWWAEAKIKSLVAGDPITARRMRQDPFTFTPQLKLVIAGNHKPRLRTVDEAIRHRLRLVPFAVTIPEGERDPHLPQALRHEWPGILRWAIDGCLAWQASGLGAAGVIDGATQGYLEAEDAFGQWLADQADTDANAWASTADLFKSWSAWATDAGEYVGSQKTLIEKLEARGFLPARERHLGQRLRGFRGIRLRPQLFDRGVA